MTSTAVTNASYGGTQVSPTTNKKSLKAEDFINMMVTQLQNQDPLEPAKNSELLAQMSQIGQLQSSTTLQDTLKTVMLQSQIGSAGNLIGKAVQGLDANNETISGIVTSVRIDSTSGTVSLELDNGNSLDMTRITDVAGAAGMAPVLAQ